MELLHLWVQFQYTDQHLPGVIVARNAVGETRFL